MAPRFLATLVALFFSLAVELRAQESATPDTATPAASSLTTESKTDTKTEVKDSAETPRRSLGDKKTASPSDSIKKPKTEQATFGAGCFWHVEAVFERLKGVNWAVSGYAGGGIPYPITRWSTRGPPGTPRSSWSISTRRSSATKTCSKCSGRTTTRRRSTGRVKTRAPSIVRSSFITTKRNDWPH